jgi:hypothetical protein
MKLHIENLTLNLHARPVMADAILQALGNGAPSEAADAAGKLPKIGAEWPGQGGRFLGVMPGQDGARDYALILPTGKGADLGKRAWGEYGKDIPGAKSDNDGLANTKAMAEAGNELAKEILALEVDGFSDLYLMSRNEARLAFVAAADAFDKDEWHWTSTQFSANSAWIQGFGGGGQVSGNESSERPVRLVRRLFL